MRKTIESIARHYMGQLHVIDLSNDFSKWYKFVYLYIPNNWLKIHKYPKRRRLKNRSK